MSVTIKVIYGTDQKVMKYPSSTPVIELLAQCIKKFRVAGGEDHGLLVPYTPSKLGKWLIPERSFLQNDVQTNDVVEFRKKHAPIKIKLADGTLKTMLVDTSISTIEVCKYIGEKLLIRNGEEFGIQMEKMNDATLRLDTNWLDPSKALAEQGVSEESHLIYKKKFFVDDGFISTDDPASIHLLYMEAHDAIVAGAYPCSQQEAIMFAAFQCQFELRNYDASQHREGTLKLEKFLPPAFLKTKNIEHLIFKEHKKLAGMTEINAKFRYIQLCRSLKTYGMSLFKIQMPKNVGSKKLLDKFLGITKQGLFLLDGKTKAIEKEYPLDHLRRWSHTETTLTLDFGNYEEDYLNCATTEGEAINNLISGYIDLILKKLQSQAAVTSTESSSAEVSAELVATPQVKRGMVNTSSFARAEESATPTFYTSARRPGAGRVAYAGQLAASSGPAQDLASAVVSIARVLEEEEKAAEGGEAERVRAGSDGTTVVTPSTGGGNLTMGNGFPSSPSAAGRSTSTGGTQSAYEQEVYVSEADKEAVKVQITQNVHTVNEAITSLLRPFSQASISNPLSAEEIAELHKQCAPQVASSVQNMISISKNSKGVTPKNRAAMLSAAKNMATTMTNFLLATQDASTDPTDAVAKENVYRYQAQMVTSAVLMETISRGSPASQDAKVVELAQQTGRPAVLVQEAVSKSVMQISSPVVRAQAQLIAAQLASADHQLREMSESFSSYMNDPAVKKTLYDSMKVYTANLNYLAQIATIEESVNAEPLSYTISELKGALNALAYHVVGPDAELEKIVVPEKLPEPPVVAPSEQDETEKQITDELEAATRAIRELGETLKETQRQRTQTIRAKPKPVTSIDPAELAKELVNEEIGENILDATKSIAVASEKLMMTAIGLQKELIVAGRVNKSQSQYKKDPAWAQGLISASQSVTFSVRQLVLAAQAASKGGEVDEEKLQVLASTVNAASVRLLTSAKVKAIPGSQFAALLGEATKAVNASTSLLLDKAKKPVVEVVVEKKLAEISMTNKAIREIEVQTKILKLQKALEEAQMELLALRKEDYSGAVATGVSAPAMSPSTAGRPGPRGGAKRELSAHHTVVRRGQLESQTSLSSLPPPIDPDFLPPPPTDLPPPISDFPPPPPPADLPPPPGL